jgi:hypothetical protein
MNFQRFSRPQTVLKTNIMVLGVFGLYLIAKFIQVFQKDFSQGLALWSNSPA